MNTEHLEGQLDIEDAIRDFESAKAEYGPEAAAAEAAFRGLKPHEMILTEHMFNAFMEAAWRDPNKAMVWSPKLAGQLKPAHALSSPWEEEMDWRKVPTATLISIDERTMSCAVQDHSCCDPCK